METTYVADLNSLGYSVVKLLIYIGRLGFVEAGFITKVVNRQSTAEQQYSLGSSANNGINKPCRALSRAQTHLNSSRTRPIVHSSSGSKLESIETWMVGMSVSNPNMCRNGMKTPWSKPDVFFPRPSMPRGSEAGVILAVNPAWQNHISQRD